MDVKIYFKKGSLYGDKPEILRNVTEIHYNYSPDIHRNDPKIAFESDIEGTGITYDIAHIEQFEAKKSVE